jgi:hypothetical protein
MKCECCGNEYDKPITVEAGGARHVFDSFECAIHIMAPKCEHCRAHIIGHGVQADGHMFCCAHCARAEGKTEARDRFDSKTEKATDEVEVDQAPRKKRAGAGGRGGSDYVTLDPDVPNVNQGPSS